MIKGLDIKILNWYYSKCEHYGGKLSVSNATTKDGTIEKME